MKLSWFRSQFIIRLCLSVLLMLLVSIGIQGNQANLVLAQSSIDSFNRGETLKLQRQIQQLESEIRRLNRSNMRSNSLTPNQSPSHSPSVVENQSVRSSDPMFERLATLLIELKDDVRNLDARMTEIEEQVNRLSPM